MDALTETSATNMRWKGLEGTRIYNLQPRLGGHKVPTSRRFAEHGFPVAGSPGSPGFKFLRTSLNVARNQLLTLPDVWSNLPLLKHLDFSFNNLSRQLGELG